MFTLTQKQFNFIMKSLKNKLLDQVAASSFYCEIQPNHPNPDHRNERVIRTAYVDNLIKNAFAEIMEEENND